MYGDFVWARRALNSRKRRFPARAVRQTYPTGLVQGPKVRKTPSWPRSWANFSLLSLYSHRNARANVHLLGQPNIFIATAALPRCRSQRIHRTSGSTRRTRWCAPRRACPRGHLLMRVRHAGSWRRSSAGWPSGSGVAAAGPVLCTRPGHPFRVSARHARNNCPGRVPTAVE